MSPQAASAQEGKPPSHRAQPATTTCTACLNGPMRVFHALDNVPANSCILLDTREEARAYPRGLIRLAFCDNCGFISNIAFDPKLTEYSGRYEETQAYSSTFNSFHEQLARSLIERHELRGKELIEIGCGKGEFLRLLCELGENRGLGFDPGYSETRGDALGASRFSVIRDFFSEKYTDRQADFVACKMTLEHIPTPNRFLDAAVRTARAPQGVVFIQVPEALRIIRDCAFEDIYYEHCSYFSAGSLSRLFNRLGFNVTGVEIEYDGQYLTVEASRASGAKDTQAHLPVDDLAELRVQVESFPKRVSAMVEGWQRDLERWSKQGKRVVIWGSGSKGVSFLTTVQGSETIEHAVDINPYRQGHFMSGTGQEIVAPQQLSTIRPDVVVVMNRIYVPEIRKSLESLNLRPEIRAL